MQRSLLIFNIILILTVFGESKNDADHYSKSNFILKNNHDLQIATAQSCRSFIPFSFDISTKLTAAQFKSMKSFFFHPFLSSLFPVDIQPAPFSTYSEQNHGYRRPSNVTDIVNFVNNAVQGGSDYSFIIRPLKYFVDQNVVNLSTADLAVNTIVFAGDSLALADVPAVKNYTSILTSNGNTLTVVLVNPDIDQTYYQQIPNLNLVVWSDSTTLIANIKSKMNCHNQGSSSLPTSTTTSSSTTSFTFDTTPIIPAPTCHSYIPFSFDVATDLTISEYASLKDFLISSFLQHLFPTDVRPAVFSSYGAVNNAYRRQNDVATIIQIVQNINQSTDATSDFNKPLGYFWDQDVADLGYANELAVNTIIFAGSPLDDVENATFLATPLTTNGNTLTVVLVNPNIDQTNYRQVPGLNVVVWSDPETTVTAIRSAMNCEPVPPISTITTTIGSTTTGPTSTSTVTSPPSTTTTTSANISTITPLISICRSYIPFSFDISQKLNSTQFANLKTFLVNPFLESLFPIDVQPTWYSSYTTANFGPRRRPSNVGEIVNYVNGVAQSTTATISDFSLPLAYLVSKNVMGMGDNDSLSVNTVIFAGDSLTNRELQNAQTSASYLTQNGNTLTVLLMDPNIDQTNYQQIPTLNIIVWSDPETTITAIRAVMNCGPLPSRTTGMMTTSTATSPPIPVCRSYIPFSFDVATDLTAAEFADLKTFLVSPFLEQLFPLDVQPAWYSTYDDANHGYDRSTNISDIVNSLKNVVQSTATTANFIQPLEYFVDQGVADLGSTNGLAVNIIIFAGSPLTDVDSANFLAPQLTTGGNTLTVVLVNPNIDQTNYRQVTGLNIVVWSDPATTIAAIRAVMNCEPLP